MESEPILQKKFKQNLKKNKNKGSKVKTHPKVQGSQKTYKKRNV